jgi:hypothetical protein
MQQTAKRVSSEDMKATLKIEATTRDALAKLGAKGDSFDAIIVRLLDEHNAKLAKKKPVRK